MILNESRFCQVTPLLKQLHKIVELKQLHWLPVYYRITFKILLISYKALHELVSEYISSLVSIQSQGRYNLRSQKGVLLSGLYVPHKTYKTLGDCAFAVAASKLWNYLPVARWNRPSISTFKSAYKTHVFKHAFLD